MLIYEKILFLCNMHRFYSLLFTLLLLCACSAEKKKDKPIPKNDTHQTNIHKDSLVNDPFPNFSVHADTPTVTDAFCSGTYRGNEFVSREYAIAYHWKGTDVAHQYSNVISKYVGRKLKALFIEGYYSKVDLRKIRMTTKGMNDGDDYVEYYIYIPFMRVSKKNAMTGFDHCGGWGHSPALKERIQKLKKSPIVRNGNLSISKLYKTKEGLQEFWIQFKHTSYQ